MVDNFELLYELMWNYELLYYLVTMNFLYERMKEEMELLYELLYCIN
jgi:hypothetical protein